MKAQITEKWNDNGKLEKHNNNMKKLLFGNNMATIGTFFGHNRCIVATTGTINIIFLAYFMRSYYFKCCFYYQVLKNGCQRLKWHTVDLLKLDTKMIHFG